MRENRPSLRLFTDPGRCRVLILKTRLYAAWPSPLVDASNPDRLQHLTLGLPLESTRATPDGVVPPDEYVHPLRLINNIGSRRPEDTSPYGMNETLESQANGIPGCPERLYTRQWRGSANTFDTLAREESVTLPSISSPEVDPLVTGLLRERCLRLLSILEYTVLCTLNRSGSSQFCNHRLNLWIPNCTTWITFYPIYTTIHCDPIGLGPSTMFK